MSNEAKKPKKIPLNISLYPEEKKAVERMAEDDDRSVSYFIGKLITKAAEDQQAH